VFGFLWSYFLCSIVEDQGRRAIGVILSGMGTDGTLGLKAIKQAGGITFVQDPSTAQYDGMPRIAIGGGRADSCLSPEGIADGLMNVDRRPYVAHAKLPSPPQVQENVAKLNVLMRAAFGNDLTYYKPNTVERRMGLHKIDKLEDTKLTRISGTRVPPMGSEMQWVLLCFEDPQTPKVKEM